MQPGPQNGSGVKTGSNKKLWIILILAVVAGALLVVWFQNSKNSPYGMSGKEKVRKEAQKLPAGFPADFPVDSTAESAKEPQLGSNGEILLELTSNLAPAQAYALYLEYFEKHSWNVMLKNQSPVAGTITAKSPTGDVVSLTFSPASENRSVIGASLAKSK